MRYRVKSKIIYSGEVYEAGGIIDLPAGSETHDLFLNKIVSEKEVPGADGYQEIQGNFNAPKTRSKKGKQG